MMAKSKMQSKSRTNPIAKTRAIRTISNKVTKIAIIRILSTLLTVNRISSTIPNPQYNPLKIPPIILNLNQLLILHQRIRQILPNWEIRHPLWAMLNPCTPLPQAQSQASPSMILFRSRTRCPPSTCLTMII